MPLFSRTTPTIYTNAVVHTFDDNNSTATSFAVLGNKFVAVGPESYVRDKVGKAETVDLEGATVIPGLVDAHVHMIDFGLMLQTTVDLVGCRSVKEVQDRLRGHMLKRPEGYIYGHGFDQELFDTPVFPTRKDLDEVTTERPIIIKRICGHAVVGNTKAFDMAPDGTIAPEARESGLLTEDDMDPLFANTDRPTDDQIDQAIIESGNIAKSLGLVGCHCLLRDFKQWERLLVLWEQKKLPIRYYAMPPVKYLDRLAEAGYRTGWGDYWLTMGPIKIFSDGSFGARTAALHEPYADDPSTSGWLLLDETELTDIIKHAQVHQFQAATHAIGDKAVDVTVNAITKACGIQPNSLRHRVEHASQITEKSLVKMAQYGIPVAVQPQFILTDFWTVNRVGKERYRWCYPFKTMQKAGVPLAMSSDCYVERLDPYELIYRAWVRDENSKAESLAPAETIRHYTRGSAFASHQEDIRGSITEGMLADAAIYDQSIFSLTPDELLKLRPRQVMIDGKL